MTTKTRKQRILERLSDGEWHTSDEIRAPHVGGASGMRRLRELRNDGYEVEKRRVEGNTFEYRLPLRGDDWINTCSCFWRDSETSNSARMIKIDPDCLQLPHPGVIRY